MVKPISASFFCFFFFLLLCNNEEEEEKQEKEEKEEEENDTYISCVMLPLTIKHLSFFLILRMNIRFLIC